MTELQLPYHFEELRADNRSSGIQPFSYVHEERVFQVGQTCIPVMEFDPYEYAPDDFGVDDTGIDVADIFKHPALIPSFGGVLGSPSFHDFVRSNPQDVNDTHQVMREVFTMFGQVDEGVDKDESSDYHLGFAANVNTDGDLRLQVFGDCACLTPDLYSLYIDDKYEAGFAQYELHNTPGPEQRASLYAGFGHLASLAADAKK